VQAHISHRGGPLQEPAVEMRPGAEALAGQGVLLDVADARLDLALGLRPVGPVGPGAEAVIGGGDYPLDKVRQSCYTALHRSPKRSTESHEITAQSL
jgi:hypothetical protein